MQRIYTTGFYEKFQPQNLIFLRVDIFIFINYEQKGIRYHLKTGISEKIIDTA